jgi:hypothetical protein
MKYLQDFNEFRAQFAKLANTAQIPKSQWVLDMHYKVYDELRVSMELRATTPGTTFEQYCSEAQRLARSLKLSAENKKKREAALRARGSGRAPPNDRNTPRPNSSTRQPARLPPYLGGFKCYQCGKTGHLVRDCPDRAANKAVDKIEETDLHSVTESEKEHL